MDHERAALTFIQVGAMTPSLGAMTLSVGAMGMGHLRRESGGGIGLQVVEVIDGHWLRKVAMDHQRAALAAIDVGGVVGLKWFDDFFRLPHPRSFLFSGQCGI